MYYEKYIETRMCNQVKLKDVHYLFHFSKKVDGLKNYVYKLHFICVAECRMN